MSIMDELFDVYEEKNCFNKSIDESWKKCRAQLDLIPNHSIDTITNLIHSYARECERLSFKNGFYYGVELMLVYIYKGSVFDK